MGKKDIKDGATWAIIEHFSIQAQSKEFYITSRNLEIWLSHYFCVHLQPLLVRRKKINIFQLPQSEAKEVSHWKFLLWFSSIFVHYSIWVTLFNHPQLKVSMLQEKTSFCEIFCIVIFSEVWNSSDSVEIIPTPFVKS